MLGSMSTSDKQVERAALAAARNMQLHPPQLDQAVDHHLRREGEVMPCAGNEGRRGR